MSKVDIIIVNWNSGYQLSEVVSSIIKYHHNLVSSVVVVDNASIDDSLVLIEQFHDLPFHFEIIRNNFNRGFSEACNQGAMKAVGEYLLFLNPDTELFENSLTAPIDYMDDIQSKKIGIAGIQLIDRFENISKSCARFPTLLTLIFQATGLNHLNVFNKFNTQMVDWSHDKTAVVDHVIGAFYLIRRQLFENLSGFDKRFFVYLEDLDLSYRAYQAGWLTVYLVEASAFHAGGGTSGQVMDMRLFYSLRSRLLYGFKHFSFFGAWTLVTITLVIEPFARIFLAIFQNNSKGVRHTCSAYSMLWHDLISIIRKSRH